MPYLNPLYSYALSAGWNVTNPTTIESLIHYPPVTAPDNLVPTLGGIVRRTLDGGIQVNGNILHRWVFPYLSAADFIILLNWGLTNYLTTASANVTIITRRMGNLYTRYNAVMHQPQPGADFHRAPNGGVLDLHIEFVIISNLGDI